MEIFYRILFIVFAIYVLLRSIAYAKYEIDQEKNKSGGICLIAFACFVTLFSVIMFWVDS
jgi:hypothetical protein